MTTIQDLEQQKQALLADRQMIESGHRDKLQALETLRNEIEQHKGAISYNLLLTKRVEDAIEGLKKQVASNETAPA